MNQQLLQKLSQKSRFPNPGKQESPPPQAPPPVDCGAFSSINLGQNADVPQAKDELETSLELKRIEKDVEDYVKSRRAAFEEKMFEKFYLMRIEQSRRFIDLIRKINKSWDDFVDYLKSIGGQGASGDGDGTVYTVSNSNSLTGLSQVTNDSN